MKINNDHFLYSDPWSVPVNVSMRNRTPKYICFSGNSGVGKSTLLKAISSEVYFKDNSTISIDEKSLHHPFIKNLFFDSENYGYLIQLNFMIQRILLVKKWIDSGYNVVMERSHLEDYIFIKALRSDGRITDDDYECYIKVWESLKRYIQVPDIIVYMDFPLEFSLNNIERDEIYGVRPKEFPDDELKKKWISNWYFQYKEFIKNLDDSEKNRVLIFDEKNSIDSFTECVINKLFF